MRAIGFVLATVLGLAFAPASASSSAQGPLFPEPVFRAQQGISGTLLIDVDADGRLDAVTAATALNVPPLLVFLGLGDGTFAEPQGVPPGSLPVAVAAGHFDADANLDLAAVTTTHKLAVYPGNGDGSFQPGIEYPVGTNPFDVLVADFDGDGNDDVVTLNYSTKDMTVFLGNGDGTFAISTVSLGAEFPHRGRVGDLNADGSLDIIFTNWVADELIVVPGNGDGSFQAPADYLVGEGPREVALADFNEDGELDAAVSNSTSRDVSILLGQGGGVLSATTFINWNDSDFWALEELHADDLDGDGHADIAVHSNIDIVVFHGVGDGTFEAGGPVVRWPGNTFDVGDVDGNGELDLVSDVGGGVAVLLQIEPRSYLSDSRVDVGLAPESLTSADFNGDGIPDLATANRDTDDVTILWGTGGGAFGSTTTLPVAGQPSRIVTADLNGDMLPDLAVACEFSAPQSYDEPVSIFLNEGAGFGSRSIPTLVARPTDLLAIDVTGDALLDLVLADAWAGKVHVLPGVGDGTFGAAITSNGGNTPLHLATGEFNGDGNVDLVVVRQPEYTGQFPNGSVSILAGNGAGSFSLLNAFGFGSLFTPEDVGVEDLDSDGLDDLVVSNLDAIELFVLLGLGGGNFAAPAQYLVPTHSLVLDDVDRDGNCDIVTGRYSEVSLLLGLGDGTFQKALGYMAPFQISDMIVADLDGDAAPDLAVSNRSGNTVTMLLDNELTTGPTTYCTAKLASPGCLPTMNFTGQPSASAQITFRLDASGVVNNKNGLLFYGFDQAAIPFLGGTLCAAPPLRRTAIQNSGGSLPPDDCSGTYSWNMNAWIQVGGDPFLVAGAEVAAQFWFRDPPASFGAGLTNAVSFTIAP